MSTDDPFGGGGDRTILRPRPGGGRRPASEVPPGPTPSAAGADNVLAATEAGPNGLVAAGGRLFALVRQLANTMSHPNPAELREHLVQEVHRFEQNALGRNFDEGTVLTARYALCTLIDETVATTPWGSDGVWASHSLLNKFHKESWGGEKFFKVLERLESQPGPNIDLLEFMYVCLALGLQGKYRLDSAGGAALERLRSNLHSLIRSQRGDFERGLSPHWKGVEDRRNPLAKFVPVWVVAAVAAIVLVLFYAVMSLSLNRYSDPVSSELFSLRTSVSSLAPIAPPPMPEADRLTLQELLSEDIARNNVFLDLSLSDRVPIRIVGDGLFDSGSANLAQGVRPLLDRISAALSQTPGPVVVYGHTDNVPIRTLQFPSNWQLSQARADTVMRVLTDQLSPDRLSAEGVADAQPIASNDTPDGRAANRRVEIVLFEEFGG